MSDAVIEIAQRAKAASRVVGSLRTEVKDGALMAMAAALEDRAAFLSEANQEDVSRARAASVSDATIDRLTLTEGRISSMASGLRAVAEQPDPVGEIVGGWRRPNGLVIEKVRVPLGVVAVIYEARPNVTADVAGLCLKSGNAAVLRGSSHASSSNRAIVDVLRDAIRGAGAPEDSVQLVPGTDRSTATDLMKAKGLVDLLVPRGGRELIQSIEENATVPFIIDGDGNCHVYVDASADVEMATAIVTNAKTQRPSVCNAAETLLVHEEMAEGWLLQMLQALADAGVEVRGDERVCRLFSDARAASEEDWETEYLDLKIAVKIVPSVDAAIEHIDRYGTSNAEAIVTQDLAVARRFVERVDSGTVLVNASTRFSDGGEFGYGAEIGISTQKLHARGPMGLRELTTTRYVVWGEGQVRT